jgi:secretion/DNA translocation related TadE-like protein
VPISCNSKSKAALAEMGSSRVSRLFSRFASESGASSVFVISVIGGLVVVFGISLLVLDSGLQDERARGAADNAAIAAADALRGFSTGYPCEVAEAVAHINMVSLDSCRIVGFDVFVTVHTKTVGIVHSARSRAGAPD